MPPPPPYFPLRWESTGDQWWYADPIDLAAANGLYDLVHHMLRRDATLLTNLTSLRRIRRLDSLWDNQAHFRDVARCRSYVARRLLHDTKDSLIRAGHGGWLLYTAASAGKFTFVRELLGIDPFLVFGEGEYGVTDILYAAARSNNSEVFRFLFQAAVSSRNCTEDGWGLTFKQEMMNRAAHAAARGGNLEILKEIIEDSGGGDALVFRDALGSTVLHSAAGRGQLEVVKYLIRSNHDIITCVDDQGNTALHVASYRAHLAVVELLLQASHPLLPSALTNSGQTFLHLAVPTFQTPGFHRVDQQLDLIKHLLIRGGEIFDIREIINLTDRCGRTALHVAVTGNINIQPTLVEFFIDVPSIDLNVRDADGMTALDLLKQLPRTAANEIVMKRLIAAGGRVANFEDGAATRPLVSDFNQAVHGSPGVTFRVVDAEILLYGGTDDASNASYDQESVGFSSRCLSETSELGLGGKHDRRSVTSAARNWKLLLHWAKQSAKGRKIGFADEDSLQGMDSSRRRGGKHVPLRLLHSDSSVPSNPSNMMRMLSSSFHTPSSSMDSVELVLGRQDWLSQSSAEGKVLKSMNGKQGSFNKRLMNKYMCFGGKSLAVEDTVHCRRPSSFKPQNSLVASVSS